jgi:hypothetical protein
VARRRRPAGGQGDVQRLTEASGGDGTELKDDPQKLSEASEGGTVTTEKLAGDVQCLKSEVRRLKKGEGGGLSEGHSGTSNPNDKRINLRKDEVKELRESVSELAVKRKSGHAGDGGSAASPKRHLEAVVQQPDAADQHPDPDHEHPASEGQSFGERYDRA